MRIALETHGCRLNQSEGDSLEQLFLQAGHEIVDASQGPDIFVLNTCAITHGAESDARQRIRKEHRIRPESSIVVTGCMANFASETLRQLPGVSAVLGNHEKQDIIELLSRHHQQITSSSETSLSTLIAVQSLTKNLRGRSRAVSRPPSEYLPVALNSRRTRGYLKIQDGCNYACSFCIVPQLRGRSHSVAPKRLLEQFVELQDAGKPEIVLTGVHLGTYGWDRQRRDGLCELLGQLASRATTTRIRLGSLDPHEVKESLIDQFLRYPKVVCRHLHLPMQSGSNLTLQSMRRAHRVEDLQRLIPKLRERIDGIAIGSDVIVGFPGEDRSAFDETYALFESLSIDYAHVFRYSPRAGTDAASLPDDVSPEEKHRRNAALRQLCDRNWLQFRRRMLGQQFVGVVLRDQKRNRSESIALTDNNIRVFLPQNSISPGKRLLVRLEEIHANGCRGQIIGDEESVESMSRNIRSDMAPQEASINSARNTDE